MAIIMAIIAIVSSIAIPNMIAWVANSRVNTGARILFDDTKSKDGSRSQKFFRCR
jgi:Tfp pilus assembly protein FimT